MHIINAYIKPIWGKSLDSNLGDLSIVVAGAQLSQDGQGTVHGVARRCLHEVKFPRLGNTQHHQLEHRLSEVDSKDLWHGERTHLVELIGGVETITFSAVRAASATYN